MAPPKSHQRLGVRAAKQSGAAALARNGREGERANGPEVRCLVRRTKSGGKPHALQDLADSARGRLSRISVVECGSPLPLLPRTQNAGSSSPNTKAAEDCRTPKASPFLRNGAVHGHSTVAVAAMNAWRSRMKPLSLLVGFCLAVAADSVEGHYTDIETAVGGRFFLTPEFGFRPCHRVRNRVGSRLLFAEFPR